MGFDIALKNVIVTLLFIAPGFVLCKCKKACADHLSTMSALLIYFCAPCMIINSFLNLEYSAENLLNMAIFFGLTLALQALFTFILYIILRKKYEDSKYRILTIGSVLGNVGFFGLPIIKALLPNNPEVLCYSSVYVISMNILVFTMGVFCLTGNKKYMTLKSAVINPSTFGLIIGLPLFIFGVKAFLPSVLTDSIRLIGEMTTPLCMIILGVRLATVSFKKLFTRPIIYLTCLMKLLVFPLFCFAIVYFIPLAYSLKASIIILAGTPCASIIFNLSEIHHSEEELSANCVLLSTLICFLTIPLLTLIC